MSYKKTICLLMNLIKLPEAYMFFRKKIFGNHIVIFIYHRVCPGKGNLPVSNTCPKEFEKQIRFLKENFTIYSLEKLINLLSTPKIDNTIKENIAVITFDDGYKDNYVYAYPILKKYQLPATIFLVSGYVGKDELFWWNEIEYILYHTKKKKINSLNLGTFLLTDDKKRLNCLLFLLEKIKRMPYGTKEEYINELKNICHVKVPSGLGKKMILSWNEIYEMKSNGISFGAHTLTHANLININLEEAEKEISHSKTMIEDKLKTDVISFAYPYGSKYFNHDIIKLLEKNGLICAVTTSEKIISKYKFYNLYNLPRISPGHYYYGFPVKASGMFSDFNNILHTLL